MAEPRGLVADDPALTSPADDWVSAHLFYQDDLTTLLVRMIPPLVAELAADFFFLRYWEGGHHLRLRVRVDGPDDVARVRELISRHAHDFFGKHPSPDRFTAADYARLAANLAAAEQLEHYTTDMYQNNSVRFIDYRREHHRFGDGDTIRAVERHFVESSRIVLFLLADGTTPAQRDTAAFSMILLTWLHIDASKDATPRWDSESTSDHAARYERQAQRLTGLTRRLRAFAGSPSEALGDGALGSWVRSIRRLAATIGDDVDGNQVLHTCAHLVCNRLGVTLHEERYLRYLVYRAVMATSEEDDR